MKYISILMLLTLFLAFPEEIVSDCCWAQWGVCNDCSRPTPFCGYDRCNIFGCNCGGGCRGGGCKGKRKRSIGDFDENLDEMSSEENDEMARPVFSSVDQDGDNLISMGEARDWLTKSGRTTHKLYHGFHEVDENNDGQIDFEEFLGGKFRRK